MTTETQPTINGNNWDVFDDDGHIIEPGVWVIEKDEYYEGDVLMAATVRIGGTLHLRSDLDISDNRIESRLAGWYLTR